MCPFNRFARPAAATAFRPANTDAVAPPLLDILALDDSAFNERFANSPIKRIKRVRLVRNACVAAGNWGDPSAVPVLAKLLQDPETIVRGHAAWALQQIDDPRARAAIANALAGEQDSQVKQELAG